MALERAMKHLCTQHTDLDELIGHDEADGYHAGPLSLAMKRGEELELLASELLSLPMRLKLESLMRGIFVVETGETISPPACFQLLLH